MKLHNVIDFEKSRKKLAHKVLDRRISKERKRVDDMLKSTPELRRR